MSNYHYLDKAKQLHGPVNEAEIERLNAVAKQEGWELLVAVPGDSNWLPYVKGAAAAPAPAPAPVIRPQQAHAPAAAPVHPPVASRPAQQAPLGGVAPPRAQAPAPSPQQPPLQQAPQQPQPGMFGGPMFPQQAPLPMPAFAPMQPFGAPGGYALQQTHAPVTLPWIAKVCYGFAILFAGVFFVGLVLFIVGLATGSKEAALAGGLAAYMGTGGLIMGLHLVWAGKVVSLLNEIAAAHRRR